MQASKHSHGRNNQNTKEDCAPVDKGRYQRLIGKLIYFAHTTPNISYTVSTVSQFMNNPNEEHIEAIYRILRYLKLTHLLFQKGKSIKL